MSDGLIKKILGAGMMTVSVGTIAMIAMGAISYPASLVLRNDSVLGDGMYAGMGAGILGGLALSYLAYREY